jgi:hypothetical protein
MLLVAGRSDGAQQMLNEALRLHEQKDIIVLAERVPCGMNPAARGSS